MRAIARINDRYGRGAAGFGATGWIEAPVWGMRQANVSPHYTTRWENLPLAHC